MMKNINFGLNIGKTQKVFGRGNAMHITFSHSAQRTFKFYGKEDYLKTFIINMENESTVKDLLEWKIVGSSGEGEWTDADRTRIDNFYYGRFVPKQYK